ncbi:MAG: hypothetical protein LBR22_04005 [Desulfovibrio sp.]|jgi:hypothetical protein|nr:hypothetical protein [Desulfovibrio sp.]
MPNDDTTPRPKIVKLTRESMRTGLSRLDEIAKAGGRRIELVIYGSGAIILTCDTFQRTTKDIDATYNNDEFIKNAINRIAEEFGFDERWLNNAIQPFHPPTFGIVPSDMFVPDENGCGLVVKFASKELLVAMKCMAFDDPFRRHDFDDLEYLIRHLGLTSVDEVLKIVRTYYPDDPLPKNLVLGIETILDCIAEESDP